MSYGSALAATKKAELLLILKDKIDLLPKKKEMSAKQLLLAEEVQIAANSGRYQAAIQLVDKLLAEIKPDGVHVG